MNGSALTRDTVDPYLAEIFLTIRRTQFSLVEHSENELVASSSCHGNDVSMSGRELGEKPYNAAIRAAVATCADENVCCNDSCMDDSRSGPADRGPRVLRHVSHYVRLKRHVGTSNVLER